MAVDEAILGGVAEDASLPTLRFYAWMPPCVSLGRSQSAMELDLKACRVAGIDCVRRPTGGRAILHRDELTYSICMPLHDPRSAGDILESYRRISDGLAEGLRSLGLVVECARPGGERSSSAACFDAPADHEITIGGRKMVGSAQFRARGALLQHGSLPLFGDVAGIVDLLAITIEARGALRARLRATALTLEQAAQKRVSYEDAKTALCGGIARALNIQLSEGALSSAELRTAQALSRQKYASLDWPQMQRMGHARDDAGMGE